MREIKQHCQNIIRILRSDYHTQLEYPGIIKKIYHIVSEILSCSDINEIPDVRWNSLIRCFADDTTDYSSPVIAELEKLSKLLKQM